MEKQVLIYDHPRPLSKERHGSWSVDTRRGYGFAHKTNAIPLVLSEFEAAAREFPIIFTESQGAVAPAALLGLRDKENLYVNGKGDWQASYIPAFIRRYPFIFAHDQERGTYTLCIDEASDRCNQDRKGEPLFTEDGAPSEYTREMTELLKSWERAMQKSLAFCRRIRDLDLLRPSEIKFKSKGDQAAKTSGFLVVDSKRLQALPAEAVVELHQNQDLGRIHAHLISLHSIQALHKTMAIRELAN